MKTAEEWARSWWGQVIDGRANSFEELTMTIKAAQAEALAQGRREADELNRKLRRARMVLWAVLDSAGPTYVDRETLEGAPDGVIEIENDMVGGRTLYTARAPVTQSEPGTKGDDDEV